ncbi:hypothetical protein EAG_13896 [Camponotus floridanus]|uniref:Uncharacterized protein n=1 Tax=Camponotus floridanus TaxID=104421 RepID=E2AK32_CAMFO|nr:hypothetical protein EAG_13896 [Camponotus floridanus]
MVVKGNPWCMCKNTRQGESLVHVHQGISGACMCKNTPPISPHDELSRFSSLHAKILLLQAFEPNGKINARYCCTEKKINQKSWEQKVAMVVHQRYRNQGPVIFICARPRRRREKGQWYGLRSKIATALLLSERFRRKVDALSEIKRLNNEETGAHETRTIRKAVSLRLKSSFNRNTMSFIRRTTTLTYTLFESRDREGRSLIRSSNDRSPLQARSSSEECRASLRSCTRSCESLSGLRKHPREQRRREPPPFYVRAVRRSRETRGHWLREKLPPPPDECADRQCGVVGGLRGWLERGGCTMERDRKRDG